MVSLSKIQVSKTQVRKIQALITSMLLLMPAHSFAQQLFGAVGMVNAGYSSIHHLTSPRETEAGDSISFGSGYTLIGAEGYYRNGKSIISLAGQLGLQAAQFKANKFVEPFAWNVHAGFGRLLSGNSRLCLYPMAGVGVSGFSITEFKRSGDTRNDITRIVKPSADLSLHCDYLLLNPEPDGDVINGIALGAKVGYNCSIFSPSQLHGWYFTISVGGLAFMRKQQ